MEVQGDRDWVWTYFALLADAPLRVGFFLFGEGGLGDGHGHVVLFFFLFLLAIVCCWCGSGSGGGCWGGRRGYCHGGMD